MAYFLLRLSLTLFTELFIMCITAHVLTMRSNAQYYRAVLVYYLIWAPLKELALPTVVRVMGLNMRRLRHDLANHLHVVSRLVESGHYDDADRYLAELRKQAHSLQQSRK